MFNPRLAGRYAKSLLDLAVEREQLQEVYNDMLYLQAVSKASADFVNMLKSPVISSEKKLKAFTAVTAGKLSELSAAFVILLVNKSRETFLPEIVDAFIEQYNTIKNIHKVKLTTAAEVSQDVRSVILGKLVDEAAINNVELETVVNENIIGGFILEFDNKLIDVSIAKDLRDLKKQFEVNAYVPDIR